MYAKKGVSFIQQQVYRIKSTFSSYLKVGVVDMFKDQSGCSGLKKTSYIEHGAVLVNIYHTVKIYLTEPADGKVV